MSDQRQSTPDSSREEQLQLVEEVVTFGKRRVVTGTVRVRTIVDEIPIIHHDTLVTEAVEVERVAINTVVDVVPPTREVDGVTIIPVVEERVRVVRELVLVEEVRMRRVRSEALFETTGSRRIMHAIVERDPAISQEHS